jgi:predicted porin
VRNHSALRSLSVITAGMVATAAHAQSSVTIYGIIDDGISWVNNSANASGGHSSLVKMDEGVDGGSRWGIRGTEDLGDGTRAVFVLENGFQANNGTISQGGAEFGRQAYVGISKEGIGTLTLGRQYSFSDEYLGRSFSTGGLTSAGNYAFHIDTLDQLTDSRINNSIKFESPNLSGLQFGGVFGFSNEAGAFGGDPTTAPGGGSTRDYSFGVKYRNGPISVGFAYTDISFPLSATPAFKVTISNINPGVLSDLRTYGVGARYEIGSVTAYGLWTNTRIEAVDGMASTFNEFEGGGIYRFTPSFAAALGYTRSQLRGDQEGTWNQINSSLEYNLSKRTLLYALVIYQKASGSNDGVPVQAQIGKTTTYFGNSGLGASNQLAFRLGIRHTF